MTAVKPIPPGFHTLTPYLIVDGAAEAIDFYAKAFGAEERFRMPGPGGRVMHAEIQLGDSVIMMTEANAEWGNKSPKTLDGSPVKLHVYVDDADALYKRAVEAGATSTCEGTDMFWGDRMGAVQDPYGHEWMIATHVKDMSPDEIAAAQAEFLKNCAK